MRIFSLIKKVATEWVWSCANKELASVRFTEDGCWCVSWLVGNGVTRMLKDDFESAEDAFLRLKNRGRVTVSGVRAYPVDISANTGIRLCVCGALNQVFGMPCVATGRCLGEMGECRGSLRSTKQAGLYLPKDIPPWIQIRWRSPAKSGVGLSM